ncbi:glycosyltransferase [Clostridium sp. C8]|uniref:glycosyltransferase n=1 Tax=Clostridium sp. C8 TaxID=1667357 RepID=UPI00069A2310|nr:glycosyltransferase [Clostridium sp. C8]
MNNDELRIQIENYIEAGYIEEANQLILQYKELIGNNDEIASMEAILKIYMGEYDEGLHCTREGLKFNINNSDLYFTMGNIYEIKKEYDRAYLCYEKSLLYNLKEENKNVILSAIENLKSNYEIKVNNYSIVILTYNQLDYTKVCINSIKNYNGNDDCEIIIIDNNSTDGTVEWIKEQEGIKYILNEENKGFPAGCNQGIEIANKDNDIFLLNNDTVIMPNSIFNLRMGLYSNEKVGATGAISNSVSYYQQISEQYDDFDGYMGHSLKNNIPDESLYYERVKLVGFAMLIKRETLNIVGLLDERFTPGNFEDDDISFRIIKEGYKLLLCKDSYIHHFGSVSFREDSKKYNKLLSINSRKFKEKWGFASEYSNFIRNEIIDFIDESKNKDINVLEIGCATGATLLEIKNRYKNANLYGIEFNKKAAEIAKSFADIRSDNVESIELSYEENFFDYIIFSDVLGSFYNPEKVLRKIKKYLKPEGYIIASIANVMHHSVIRQLINGSWAYDEVGILDKKNIRFFTKSEIMKIVSSLGYKDIVIKSMNGFMTDEDKDFIEQISKLSVVSVSEEFETYNYLVKAKNYDINNEKFKRKITFLIRRLEFDVDVEESIKELIEYIKSSNISFDDIIDIIAKDIVNKVYILNYIAIKCFENNLFDYVIPLLCNAYEISPRNLETKYNIANVLNSIGEKESAIKYLENLTESNEKIEKLKLIIKGEEKNEL